MSQKSPYTKMLKDMSQCEISLDFGPLSAWPTGLPAVAINGKVIAGFTQTIVFDHQLEESDSEAIAALFRSLYFDLTAAELARLFVTSKNQSWFPFTTIANRYQLRWNEQTANLAEAMVTLPINFQNFSAEKKWSFADFQPLLSARSFALSPILLLILQRNLSRSIGALALELWVELKLLGHNEQALQPSPNEDSELWLKRLKTLRYPHSSQKDEEAQNLVNQLPWPGTSKARWIRQGDRAGIELKLFVANPTDLKKYVQSLTGVQDALEKEDPWKKH